ncbi:hypothetical protein PENSOL_c037G01434 [Penicillium solitum]|uniref:HIT domain-containing protein n=1 Tax=Penicillium solitum TaxID=60172 RepID=A0A1V6QUL1_9EURO|nr:uncharacterized protein PENSOL_c037G01434 [Penicillium solitum]OQD92879.1 hypothetical protein PENSOL_c037G01434 [Penicillium solitum]
MIQGKVPGHTIIVPRTYLAPDSLGLPDEYDLPNAASQATTRDLMGHHAHTKIISIHGPSPSQKLNIAVRGPAPYSEDYQGYMTTQLGLNVKDEAVLTALAEKARFEIETRKVPA